jgi:hypothetical protein
VLERVAIGGYAHAERRLRMLSVELFPKRGGVGETAELAQGSDSQRVALRGKCAPRKLARVLIEQAQRSRWPSRIDGACRCTRQPQLAR